MSFNFPNAPLEGALYTPVGGYQYIFLDGKWRVVEAPQAVGTTQSRNRIVNGAMQISQENGNTPLSSANYYPADQWSTIFSTSVGTIWTQRVATNGPTPNGSTYRIQQTVTVADTSLAATEHLAFMQRIEGIRIVDFQWGTASAKQVVLRFGFRSTVAGTYSVSLYNSAANRTWLAPFTIAAGQINTDTTQTFVIPGDVTGTWLNDTGIGIQLLVTLAAGTTLQGVAGWQGGGNLMGVTGMTNGLATVNAIYQLFDVGLYLDPLATGIAPPWVMPDEAEELRACQRYYFKSTHNFTQGFYAAAASYALYCSYEFPVAMRTNSAVTFTPVSYAVTIGPVAISSHFTGFNTYMNSSNAGQVIAYFIVAANARM